jgi:predicted TIM-barrel fold metal-dependent hydrolase
VSKPTRRGARARDGLAHPVIDGDGHYIDLRAPFDDFVRERTGRDDLTKLAASTMSDAVTQARQRSGGEIRAQRMRAPGFWVSPGDTRYWAAVTIPELYHAHLSQWGIDFAVLYPTRGLLYIHSDHDDARATVSRLFNEYVSELFQPYSDRLAPAAIIPLHSPEEGVAALEHACSLGFKVGMIPSYVRRTLPGWSPRDRDSPRWLDTFGIDSEHDYDPFWARAVELGMPLACHSIGMGFDDRSSPSNYMYNHIGNFAAAGEGVAKSLFFGGVPRRFPELRVAFLEGGAAVGVRLYCDLVSRWEKRGPHVLDRLNPAHLDRGQLHELLERHGASLGGYDPEVLVSDMGSPDDFHDDFEFARVSSVDDIRDAFCRSFAWGCEADDPMVGLAFDGRITPLGAKIPAFMGSDIGHWDVPDPTEPLEEALGLVDRGIIDEASLREFVFANPVKFYASGNPDFFAGTAIESEAAAVLHGTATA